MPTSAFPLNMPDELLRRVRASAKRTRLSMADVMRQAIYLGIPVLEERLQGENPPPGFFASDYQGPVAKRRTKLEDQIAKTLVQVPER